MCLTTDRIAGSGSVTHDDPISQRYLVVIMGYESETHATFMGERLSARMCLTTDRIAGSGSVTHDDPISQRYLVVIMGYESETHATFMGERREQAPHKLTGAGPA